MPREAPKQAESWDEIQIWMNELDKVYVRMPAPPRPSDTWGEKVNQFHRTVEGMREQIGSEVEHEDAARARAAAMDDDS